eukprot:GHVT01088771.1.p1 GENE.GHVT01088771.1~~GHVT01088771.1.p1  ORF type:complete len:144 (+),score=18.18 GHVT01088771.1:433-864(+)
MSAPASVLLIAPGRPAVAATATDVPGVSHAFLPSPGEISEICTVLTSPLSSDLMGVAFYSSVEPFAAFEFIGVLTNSRPSALLPVGWAFIPDFASHAMVKIVMYVHWAPPRPHNNILMRSHSLLDHCFFKIKPHLTWSTTLLL